MPESYPKLAYDVLGISIASILGALTRVGVNTLFSSEGTNTTSRDGAIFFDMPANIFGCFILGFVSASAFKSRLHPSVFLSISTGYAGSVTTFAAWNFQAIKMFASGDWIESLLALFLGVCVAIFAYIIGGDVACATHSLILRLTKRSNSQIDEHNSIESRNLNGSLPTGRRVSTRVVTLGLLTIVFGLLLATCIAMAVVSSRSNRKLLVSFFESACFAPIGALLRWRLSKLNNRVDRFPIGTLIANVSATMLIVALDVIILRSSMIGKDVTNLLNSLKTGVAGCLSTVSTWVSETILLPTLNRYVYVISTILIAQILGLIVYGPVLWTA